MGRFLKITIGILCLSLMGLVIKSEASIVKINDFTLDVNNDLAEAKTRLTFNWDMDYELAEFRVFITLANGQKELSYVYSYSHGRDNLGKFVITENANHTYHYFLEFQVNVVRTGNFNIEIEYNVDGNWYEYRNYVIAKGEVVDTNFFTLGKAILVGTIIAIFTIIGSLLIFESSKNEYELNDDSTSTIKVDKRVDK